MPTGLESSLPILELFNSRSILETGLTSALLAMSENLAVEMPSLKLRIINSEKNVTVCFYYFCRYIILSNDLK